MASVSIGTPEWTSGHFRRISAQDDLGLESVGANLLRRLLPGILQTSPNAGYYSFYPYLLWRWQQDEGSLERTEFKRFYRRQETAYALACQLHQHRGNLIGLNGSIAATNALREQGAEIRVADLAERYMDSPYGGYGLFYARVLADIRLTQLGAQRYVDRVTDIGSAIAAAFAESFEQTRYFREYIDAEIVPREVLEELGQVACLCALPGRPDHRPLIDLFFGEPVSDPAWELRRRTRVETLALFLDYHRQRPTGSEASLTDFRRVLAERAFADGQALQSRFPAQQSSWRLYQLRECQTLTLTSLWTAYLRRLEQAQPLPRQLLEEELVRDAELAVVGMDPQMETGEALALAGGELGGGADLVDAARTVSETADDDPPLALAQGLRVALALVIAAHDQEEGFAELVGEGGPGRWSLAFMRDWFERRAGSQLSETLAALLAELHDQHARVAISKLSESDLRDPFCVAEDEGEMRLIRLDAPFWTGARFGVVNHLLWTLGLLTSPEGDARLTESGESVLMRVNADG